jgi:hypothetical protein
VNVGAQRVIGGRMAGVAHVDDVVQRQRRVRAALQLAVNVVANRRMPAVRAELISDPNKPSVDRIDDAGLFGRVEGRR